MAAILNSAIMDSSFCTTKIWLHSFILTQLDDGSHLEFCHVGFNTAILDSDILLSSSQIHSKRLDHTICTKNDFTDSFWLNLMMAFHLEFCHLGFSHLVFPLKLTHTCQDWFPLFAQKRTSLIHSDSTWWWQPSWTLPCWIQTLPSWIQTPCYLLSDSLKNTLSPLWLWLKLIQSD